MAKPGNHFGDLPESSSSNASPPSEITHNQLEFEVDFFSGILRSAPNYVDVLRVLGNLLSLKGRYAEGLKIDRHLVRLRPFDALAHYNLACSYALTKRVNASLRMLRRAVELGYRDFRYMREDHDLDLIKDDPRFRKLLREYENS
jgi:tetratricopeptide (TPR) repeat protein